jgi:hypothetical protein
MGDLLEEVAGELHPIVKVHPELDRGDHVSRALPAWHVSGVFIEYVCIECRARNVQAQLAKPLRMVLVGSFTYGMGKHSPGRGELPV